MESYQTNTASQPASNTTPLKGPYTYLALGDSYTIGQSVDIKDPFPYQLQNIMAIKGFNVTTPNIIAVTGWTTGDLKNAIQQAGLNQQFDFVTLLIGVNNQYQGKSQTDYRTDFVQLLTTAIGFAGGNKQKVFVLSIPDYSVTPFAASANKAKIATEIDQFNAINSDESTKAGVNYLDITPISRQAAADASLIASDGLHPSAKMYALWVQQLSVQVAGQLGK
ncbi:lysophospholipase L1-like esterase [Mucilaginibacter gracilis]|uniref:Lysophospholipase L1-like esterase n=1 Tax=Mucilaginibacter gracilis TaxID=423350 RepID=A0A495J9M8_9SPHI|nr:SGNH/GDSL hydrolase family protein [Mucilaginibacter gracilis]RKR85617.1 lysophospholipase L1-like esterase [Mucilaginibacter gracilis]